MAVKAHMWAESRLYGSSPEPIILIFSVCRNCGRTTLEHELGWEKEGTLAEAQRHTHVLKPGSGSALDCAGLSSGRIIELEERHGEIR